MASFDLEAYKKHMEEWRKLPDIGVIYLIRNLINGKEYVGQTTQSIYKRLIQHKCSKHLVGQAIRKYGVASFEIFIIGRYKSFKDMNREEEWFIREFKTQTPNGYNILIGGLNYPGRIPWNKGLKGAQIAWNKGIYNKFSAKVIEGTNIKTGNIIVFPSAMEAQRQKGFHNSWIIQCCKGTQKQHKGYTWRYLNEKI